MEDYPQLIVMLTHNDLTIPDAEAVFEQCRNSPAAWFGFKEEPLPLEQMKALCHRMKDCGKHTALEVVAYSEEEGLEGALLAVECGFEMMMGTKYSPAIHAICKKAGLKYMPFVGRVEERPSILYGSALEMLEEARALAEAGVDGIDLLGYRSPEDADLLIREFVAHCPLPVCVVGSINDYGRLDTLRACRPWAFTIGSAFFENHFGGPINEQIETVCQYMQTPLTNTENTADTARPAAKDKSAEDRAAETKKETTC